MPRPERRNCRRYSVVGVGVQTELISGKLLNLGIGGLAIETSTPLRVGRRYALRVGDRDTGRSIQASVCWCQLFTTRRLRAGEITPIYRAGLAIESGH